MKKWAARVEIDGHLHSEIVSVYAENAKQASEVFYKKFVKDHTDSEGTMWADYVELSDWESVGGTTMNDNTCVCCGRPIPEGTMVCPICKAKAGQLGKIRKREKTYTVTQSYLDKMVKQAALELLEKGIREFRDQELPMIREDVRKILSLYQSIWRDVLGEMGLLTRDNAKEILTKTAERWDHVDALIMNGNMHELQQYANSLGADEDVFLGDLLERKDTPEQIAEIILEEDDNG